MAKNQRLAVITGASSGLGEVFARKLAAQGWNLLLAARRLDRLTSLQEQLEAAHGVRVEVAAVDLTDAGQVAALARRMAAEPDLEMLVNNAGFGTKGLFWDVPLERHRAMHEVHVMAVVELTHAALNAMRARDRGAIINVSSVAAYVRSPGAANYCATKGWLNDISEGIWHDLRAAGSRIRVQALCPGFTYTEFHDTLGASRDAIPRWLWLSGDEVVEASLRGLEAGKLFVIPNWKYRLAAAFLSKIPTALRLRLGSASPHTKTRLDSQ